MGVYINGMTMPKSCFECDLYDDENNFCKAQKEYMPFASLGRDYKDANCPMVEVSEPHGRLIDADKLIIDLMDRGLEGIQTDDYSEIQQTIIVQDTAIEAEGE